jgi:transposase
MATTTKRWIGIDVSKDTLRAAWQDAGGQWQIAAIPNTLPGIRRWIEDLGAGRTEAHVVLESTGTYSSKVVYLLHHFGVAQSVITPRQSSQFSGVLKNITKNDERDACSLALYGQHMQPPLFQMPGEEVERLRQTRSVISQLKKQRRALGNQRHALEQYPHPPTLLLDSLDETMAHLDQQIEKLEKDMCTLGDELFGELNRRIRSVKGIGPKTATALIIATNGLAHFTDVKQLAKFVGLAPTERCSGSSLRARGRLNNASDHSLRALFYTATWSALKSNRACREIHKRLRAKGKPPKVALCAVAHKLLRQVWAVAKNDTLFDNDFEFKTA